MIKSGNAFNGCCSPTPLEDELARDMTSENPRFCCAGSDLKGEAAGDQGIRSHTGLGRSLKVLPEVAEAIAIAFTQKTSSLAGKLWPSTLSFLPDTGAFSGADSFLKRAGGKGFESVTSDMLSSKVGAASGLETP